MSTVLLPNWVAISVGVGEEAFETKLYTCWFSSSLKTPTVWAIPEKSLLLAVVNSVGAAFSHKPLLLIVWTEPVSEPSEVAISIFRASLYSPLGTNLSSRSLFILALRKFLFNSAMY